MGKWRGARVVAVEKEVCGGGRGARVGGCDLWSSSREELVYVLARFFPGVRWALLKHGLEVRHPGMRGRLPSSWFSRFVRRANDVPRLRRCRGDKGEQCVVGRGRHAGEERGGQRPVSFRRDIAQVEGEMFDSGWWGGWKES